MMCVKVPAVCCGGFCIACRVFKGRVRKVPPPEELGVRCCECGARCNDPEIWVRWFSGPDGRKCFRCMRIMQPHAVHNDRPKRKKQTETETEEQQAVA